MEVCYICGEGRATEHWAARGFIWLCTPCQLKRKSSGSADYGSDIILFDPDNHITTAQTEHMHRYGHPMPVDIYMVRALGE